MAGVKTNGIVIKQTDFGEGDRMLWIFTEDFGIVKAVGRGARKSKNKSGSSGQFLCYGEFDFFCGGEIWNLNAFSPKEAFEPVQYDFSKLALCNYFSELILIFLDYANPDKMVLRLFLNTLYACAYKNISQKTLKLAFELKLLCLTGFCPKIDACSNCGDEEIYAFDLLENGVLCKNCKNASCITITNESLLFLRYIICCDIKKLFAYEIPHDTEAELSYIAERYLKYHADREIKSLDYYKKFI